jgi:hypothetical protein
MVDTRGLFALQLRLSRDLPNVETIRDDQRQLPLAHAQLVKLASVVKLRHYSVHTQSFTVRLEWFLATLRYCPRVLRTIQSDL